MSATGRTGDVNATGGASACPAVRVAPLVRLFIRPVLAGWLVFSASVPCRAGKLDTFESEATNESASNAGHDDDGDHHSRHGGRRHGRYRWYDGDDDDDCGLGDMFAEVAVMTFLYGGACSTERVLGEGDEFLVPRESGEALIPFARLDISYQDVASDVRAIDTIGELGFACLSLQVRHTHYSEDAPDAGMDLTEIHGVYRMSFGNSFELDWGMGSLRVSGQNAHSGLSITTPMRFYPTDAFGLEYRPMWSTINENRISGHDLAVLAGWRFARVRLGYRWMSAGNASLNGPELGLSLAW